MTDQPDDALTGSYNVVDYRIRPAKYAERIMIAEVASRLRFYDIQSYRYVGMGAIYFADFKLMHRSLGINKLISIEGREQDTDRFDWNRPYSQIEMRYGNTRKVLPGMTWDEHSIVWLDYDGQLNIGKLEDIDLLIRSVKPGSFLVFSVNAEKPSPEGMSRDERDKDLVGALKRLVGNERVDPALKSVDLKGRSAAKVYYQLISDAIEASLAKSNALEEAENLKRRWQQVLHITYKDGALMLSVGGIVLEERQMLDFEKGEFDRLHFVRSGAEAYNIEVPKLTFKEMSHLELSALGLPDECDEPDWLKPKDRKNFLRLHRYLPNFVSTEI